MSEEITPANAVALAEEPSPIYNILEQAIVGMGEDTDSDVMLFAHERLKFYEREGKRLRKLLEERMIARMEKHGDIEIGNGRRYYPGRETETTCNDKAKTLEAILTATGGDFGAVVECLSSSAILSGKARNVLGEERFKELFTRTQSTTFNEGAAKPKKLMIADDRFKKGPKRAPTTGETPK